MPYFSNDNKFTAVPTEFIKKHLSGKRIIMVSSMMADKDYMSYLSTVAPLADVFIDTPLPSTYHLITAPSGRFDTFA